MLGGLLFAAGFHAGWLAANRKSTKVTCIDSVIYGVRFRSQSDAEDVLDALRDFIKAYGRASIADLMSLAGCYDINYRSDFYGWTDLEAATISIQYDSYGRPWSIKLPQPIKL